MKGDGCEMRLQLPATVRNAEVTEKQTEHLHQQGIKPEAISLAKEKG